MQVQNIKTVPPIAKKIPKKLKKHGHVRTDNYYWLNERENPEVLAYLKEENDYTLKRSSTNLQKRYKKHFSTKWLDVSRKKTVLFHIQ